MRHKNQPAWFLPSQPAVENARPIQAQRVSESDQVRIWDLIKVPRRSPVVGTSHRRDACGLPVTSDPTQQYGSSFHFDWTIQTEEDRFREFQHSISRFARDSKLCPETDNPVSKIRFSQLRVVYYASIQCFASGVPSDRRTKYQNIWIWTKSERLPRDMSQPPAAPSMYTFHITLEWNPSDPGEQSTSGVKRETYVSPCNSVKYVI
jgi:hypothetical protein